MSKYTRLNDLLSYADKQQRSISNDLGNYQNKEVPAAIEIQVKNYLENLRSILDYIAADVCECVLKLGAKHKSYFPMCFSSEHQFIKHCRKNFPNLEKIDSNLLSVFESIQQFKTDKYIKLKTLTKLVNTNKHRTLTKQQSVIEDHQFAKFKIVGLSELKQIEDKSDEYDGFLIADETGKDQFLGSKFILENIGNVIEFEPQSMQYIAFKLIDSDLDVIATLINLYDTVSNVKDCFKKPLYERYSL